MMNFGYLICVCIVVGASYAKDFANAPQRLRTTFKNTNIRKGPSHDYPIFFKIKNTKNYPLTELIAYGDWVKVVDFENSKGWVYKNLVTSKQASVIFKRAAYILSKPKDGAKRIALIGKHNTALIVKQQTSYSFVLINGLKGWVKNTDIWPDK